ncbi:MAG: NADPH-dependent 7-cyano-7-deazaguanine reductase QueF [Halioglobus sp.]
MSDSHEGLLLGKHTPVVEVYSPELLYPIPRSIARNTLGLQASVPFYGVDLWHAYEMSWLDANGKPVVRVGRFTIPASSPNIVESKSFKLYLNSLNNTRFENDGEARQCIERDIGAAAGAGVFLKLFEIDDPILGGSPLTGINLDAHSISSKSSKPDINMLKIQAGFIVEEQVYSHLLRSLCPVTGQPDWATLWIHYRGDALDHQSLLAYIVSYREHQEYHEQCVERMFLDICKCCSAQFLHIQAFYTRRGGLDINPFRSSSGETKALPRLNRQ